jgi:hypothetical protein
MNKIKNKRLLANPYEYYNMKVGIRAHFLFSGRNAHPDSLLLASYGAVKKQIQRGHIGCLRHSAPGHPLLLDFNSIPKMWQLLSIEVFGAPDEAIRRSVSELSSEFFARTGRK